MFEHHWDETTDVVVVGSGAAGLAASIVAAREGAEVVLLEKAELLGVTSAWSGGEAWVPCNDHMAASGFVDSREDALASTSRQRRRLAKARKY